MTPKLLFNSNCIDDVGISYALEVKCNVSNYSLKSEVLGRKSEVLGHNFLATNQALNYGLQTTDYGLRTTNKIPYFCGQFEIE